MTEKTYLKIEMQPHYTKLNFIASKIEFFIVGQTQEDSVRIPSL